MLTLLPKGVQNKYLKNFLIEDFSQFATGVNDTSGAPWAANISANFLKNSPKKLPQGLGGNWFMKKPEVEELLAMSL